MTTQSPELAGGAGFTFEDAVSALFLSALLGENYAPGVENSIVYRVALQQRQLGAPLDDVIVDFRDGAGSLARLSLQVKRSLTISAAKTNSDFREVIQDSWKTYQGESFRLGVDRYGPAVGEIAKDKARSLVSLCELARESVTTEHFEARFKSDGNASEVLKKLKRDITTLLTEAKGSNCSLTEVHKFLAHFVLLEFDFLHGGASDPPMILTQLRECLTVDQASQAPALWAALRQAARNSAGKSGEFYRPRLVSEMSRIVRLRAAPSLRSDLEKISDLTRSWVADIQNDVGGTHLARPNLAALLEEKRKSFRFVQIIGLPGNGKSVLLRQCIEADLTIGPVLFLKSDRIDGKGWASFSSANGLSSAPLVNLLTEIGTNGASTLYIDGIDRIEKEHQPVVLDIIRIILSSPFLSEWKIVVSLRDTGIEPLRNWLGEALNTMGVATVSVNALNDEEAKALATSKPALHPLLFGSAQIQEIVRRPFFAKILNQSFGSNDGAAFEPRSEVDLIENWWKRGGYNAEGQNVIDRQRAIIEIGEIRGRQLNQPISLGQLKPTTIGLIDQLSSDGILQHVTHGHSVRFAHDIFFEWSFFHVLTGYGTKWPEMINACGEPPAVARVVELISQREYKQDENWTTNLHLIVAAKMRSQWTRAWLLGPIAASMFDKNEAQFYNVVSADRFHFLKKALVWFQAEKTTPNPDILASELPTDKRIRFADALGWPSNFSTWRRLIMFLLERINDIPHVLYPDIVLIFEVWQNALVDLENEPSRAILGQVAQWLHEIDQLPTADRPIKDSVWNSFRGLEEFRKSLGRLILRAGRVMPELTEEYLKHVISVERLTKDQFEEIVSFSPILAATHGQLLVDLTLKHLKEELPDERSAREKEEIRRAGELRREALKKPESERTRRDEMIINGMSSLLFPSFSYHDWDRLSIEDDSQNFWPPSPLREPFYSLFKVSPDLAISMFNDLCNHAVTSWRQLHRHIREHSGTPIPLEIQFPWGIQQFWGGTREYLWHRGMWAPQPLASGFMALEEWCFDELEKGRDVDELVKKVIEGNQSVGILGMATMIALHTEQLSEAIFPIVTAQRLWSVDRNRLIQDMSNGMTALMGFTKAGDLPHVEAIKAASARAVRKMELRWLASIYILNKEFGGRAKQAIIEFENNLPFETEEDRNDPSAYEYLKKQAHEYIELADRKNYHVANLANEKGLVEVVHVSPSASMPENITRAEQATIALQEGNLWALASKAFENGRIDASFNFPAAIELAQRLDSVLLYKAIKDEDNIRMRRGAVAAIAALVLNFSEGRTVAEHEWARDVIYRAVLVPEHHGDFWSPHGIIPWHQGIFAARGLSAEIKCQTNKAEAANALLTLLGHPLEVVALTALEQIVSVFDKDPKLTWAAIHLALTLCHIEPQTIGPRDPLHSKKKMKDKVTAAIEYYQKGKGWPDLPLPPPAWIMNKKAIRSKKKFYEEGGDVIEILGQKWSEPTTHWYSQYASKIIKRVPYEQILEGDAKGKILSFITNVFKWTSDKISPSWLDKGNRDRHSADLFEWNHALGDTMGRISGMLTLNEVSCNFLEPIFKLEGKASWAFLSSFVNSYICRYIYDAQTVPRDAIGVLDRCLEHFLKASAFKRDSYRSGEFYGFDQPNLVDSLMFVSVERAALASRFVNGDWKEIELIMPIIDRFIHAGGWSSNVISRFLTLCERSKAVYPSEKFADQIIAVIGDGPETLKGWHGTFIPARIAGLVEHFASRDTPMAQNVTQKLLRILDLLVDMGDRRSAALQMSESFREIKIT